MNCIEKIRLMFRLEFEFKTMFKTVFKTTFETHVHNRVQDRVRKIKKIANKNMSFLKITDPNKSDFKVNECLKTSQNIQQNLL